MLGQYQSVTLNYNYLDITITGGDILGYYPLGDVIDVNQ